MKKKILISWQIGPGSWLNCYQGKFLSAILDFYTAKW